jgi:hypothetical protein
LKDTKGAPASLLFFSVQVGNWSTMLVPEEITSNAPGNRHKRALSKDSEQNTVGSPSNVPVPANKKAKSDANVEAADGGDIQCSEVGMENDIVTMVPNGSNVFYGFADGLIEFFDWGGEEMNPFWPKSMIMDAYRTLDDHKDLDVPVVAMTYNAEDLQTPEGKLLKSTFNGLDGDWWYEVTLTHEEPEGMKLRVEIESGRCSVLDGFWGLRNLGKWWLSDIKVAEGESLKAIEAIHSKMF